MPKSSTAGESSSELKNLLDASDAGHPVHILGAPTDVRGGLGWVAAVKNLIHGYPQHEGAVMKVVTETLVEVVMVDGCPQLRWVSQDIVDFCPEGGERRPMLVVDGEALTERRAVPRDSGVDESFTPPEPFTPQSEPEAFTLTAVEGNAAAVTIHPHHGKRHLALI